MKNNRYYLLAIVFASASFGLMSFEQNICENEIDGMFSSLNKGSGGSSNKLRIINCSGWGIEKHVYNLLENNPLKQDFIYLACPWNILFEHFVARRKSTQSEYLLSNLMNVPEQSCDFIVCSQYLTIPHIIPILKKIGVKTIFTPGARIQQHQINGLNIVPMPYLPLIKPQVSQQKNILYSFVGWVGSHRIRKKILLMEHPENCVIISTPRASLSKYAKERYTDILSRSRYSLCPRGWQPNSYRFYESLGSGAIPILISDEAWLPALPSGMSWDDCIIRIAEKDIDKIPAMISSIKSDDEERMRNLCLKAYESFSGDNFVRVIREYYESNF